MPFVVCFGDKHYLFVVSKRHILKNNSIIFITSHTYVTEVTGYNVCNNNKHLLCYQIHEVPVVKITTNCICFVLFTSLYCSYLFFKAEGHFVLDNLLLLHNIFSFLKLYTSKTEPAVCFA